jgi:hypothetical protein
MTNMSHPQSDVMIRKCIFSKGAISFEYVAVSYDGLPLLENLPWLRRLSTVK